MLLNGFATPIRLEPKPSKLFLQFIVLAHVFAMSALIYPSSLLPGIRLLLVIAVIASAMYHYLKHKLSVHDIWLWQQSGEWQSARDDFTGTWWIQRIFSITRYFVAIRLVNPEGKHQDLLWIRDQFDAQIFRRLRVRLVYSQVEATRPGETI